MKTADDDDGNEKFWCLAEEDSILEVWNQATLLFLLVISNHAPIHLVPLGLTDVGNYLYLEYIPSFPVAVSLAESSEKLLSIIVAGGSGGGFASSCGTGFIADSQFGYVIFD